MNLLSIVVKLYLPTFFSVKCMRLFVFTKPGFPKITDGFRRLTKLLENFRRLPKISRQLSKITEGVERLSTTSKTGPTISKGFPTSLEHCYEDVLMNSWAFLSNYTRYCQAWEIGLNAWDHNFDPKAWDSNIMRELETICASLAGTFSRSLIE